ncbi:DUF397 domain-containing protein [Nocardiopsis dassonvillei]|uniref:DUF397 domain-containing protein n=1 Tax=Nocardiopsis dassonvillei TaxID=2014 RepID=UPI003F54A1D0
MSVPAEWHKSTYSANGHNCVEAREHVGGADVRDSQNPHLGHFTFSSAEWTVLLQDVKGGRTLSGPIAHNGGGKHERDDK